MTKLLGDLRPVYVVGVGWHRYQRMSEMSYIDLGLTAVREALKDAGVGWETVDESFISVNQLGEGTGLPLLKHLGASGKPLVHVENTSASGSAAFRLGCIQVAAGISDVALVLGVDKPRPIYQEPTGVQYLASDAVTPMATFSLASEQYRATYGATKEDLALIAVKNHANAALNPNAHRQQVRSLTEVLESRRVTSSFTALQCCPIGEGAAAVLIASEDAIARWGIAPSRPVRVASSAANSEGINSSEQQVSAEVIARALLDAQVRPDAVDLFELHDAFTIEEAQYTEGAGIALPGQYLPMLKDGAFDRGGQCAISTSGGLIGMGHPVGPTGVGQIGELALQLRGDAGRRQHPGARVGLAQMVGLGTVGYAHVLIRE